MKVKNNYQKMFFLKDLQRQVPNKSSFTWSQKSHILKH